MSGAPSRSIGASRLLARGPRARAALARRSARADTGPAATDRGAPVRAASGRFRCAGLAGRVLAPRVLAAIVAGASAPVAGDAVEPPGNAGAETAAQGAFEAGAFGTGEGVAIVEGDVVVSAAVVPGFRGVAPGGGGLRWPHGEVPYRIDASLGTVSVRAVEEAVRHWNRVAAITLIALPGDGPAPPDHLVFRSGPGCASWVGRQGGAQAVWIGPTCTSGSVMHEIGHALGLEHEHTRPDRDRHVRVRWERVLPGKRHNFEPAPRGALALGDYDIESIMHYGPTNFSVDGTPTLEPLDTAASARMGQRVAPSAGDIASVARLYASDLALALRVDADVEGGPDARELALFVTNEHEQGAHDVRVTIVPAGGRTPPFRVDAGSEASWRCAPGAGTVGAPGAGATGPAPIECRLPRLGGGAASRLVLALEGPVTETTLSARVSSRTPDLDLSNNGGDGADADAPELARALSATPLANVLVVDDAADERSGTSAGAASGWPWLGLGAFAAFRGRRRARY